MQQIILAPSRGRWRWLEHRREMSRVAGLEAEEFDEERTKRPGSARSQASAKP